MSNYEIVSVNEHFFTRLDQPYLAIMINYKLPPIAVASAQVETGRREKRREETWREYVAESDIPLFNALRDWRLERSKRDGLPIYVIFTNRELGAIIAARPASISQLGQVQGVGSGKIKSYGTEVLTVLGQIERAPTPERAEEAVALPVESSDGTGSE